MMKSHRPLGHSSIVAATAFCFGLLPACGPKQKAGPATDHPDLSSPGPDAGSAVTKSNLELTDVPATIKVERVDPMDGNDPSARSPVLDIMLEENQRWAKKLASVSAAPAYYLGYQLLDQRRVIIEADGGGVIDDRDESDRFLDVEVRVGSPALDNRHPIDDPRGQNEALIRRTYAPFGKDSEALRTAFWLETDRRYREAAMQWGYVLRDKSTGSQKDEAADFVREPKEVYIQRAVTLDFDKKYWVDRMRKCSRDTLHYPNGKATRATCTVMFERDTMYLVNSEGTQLQTSWTVARLMVTAGVKAPDGEGLARLEQRFARTPADLPNAEQEAKMVAKVATELAALHDAPVADPYVGPAILQGRAAGVFFHEVFGHRIEGHRQKDQTSGRTFSSKVGEQIMPDWLTVYDDPTLTQLNHHPLIGFYRFDDEGVRAQRAKLVENGVLEGFVMGRNPIPGFPKSNGHGRKELGSFAVSRQGNTVVEAKRSVDDDVLVKQLISEVKRQKKPFGMIFTDISGGFTQTSTFEPQSFKVHPTMAYRIYPDGKRELVRGVDIVGTPLTALGSIVSAGRSVETFNGTCGAESGWVPVSASAPSLLVEKLELERRPQPPDRSPVLPSPEITARGGAR